VGLLSQSVSGWGRCGWNMPWMAADGNGMGWMPWIQTLVVGNGIRGVPGTGWARGR